MEPKLYAKWLSMLCAAMAVFGAGVMLVGYKSPTFGLVGTVIVLVVGAVLLALKAR